MERSKQWDQWSADEAVTDILINGWNTCFVERNGELVHEISPFPSQVALLEWLEQVFVALGTRYDARHPYLEGMWNGMRLHAILPPVAPGGPLISLRRPSSSSLPLESFGERWVSLLRQWVWEKKNLLIVGATGSGKTTLLTRLLEQVSPTERLVILEDSPELIVEHPHAVHLLTRGAGPEGWGEVTLSDLLKNALRMRPDRLLVGEIRGEEAWDLLQALNTGHRGALCTLHGNSPAEALARLEALAAIRSSLPGLELKRWIRGAVDGVIFMEREGGVRGIREMTEIIGTEGDWFRLQPATEGLGRTQWRGTCNEVPSPKFPPMGA